MVDGAEALGTAGVLVRQTVAVAKRRRRTRTPIERLSLGGTHWRADGAPKAGYMSEAEARLEANRLWIEERIDLSTYQCEFCGAWHMGKSSLEDR